MKTTNNVQKTAKTKVQRILIKSVAVIVSFVLISLTVSAHGFWKQILVNNSYGKMAILMVDQQNEATETLAYSGATTGLTNEFAAFHFIEPANDKFLVVENWMTEECLFGSAGSINEQTDDNLRIESWMLDETHFSNEELVPETATDGNLSVESWMVNDRFWSL